LNSRLSDTELAWQIGDVGPRLLVVETRTAALADRARHERPDLVVANLDDASVEVDDEAAVALRLEHDTAAILAIIYTSGTTGRPKGAMLTVGNFWWSAVGSALNLGTHADDRWLACLPLFHVGGLSIVFRAAIYGIAAVVHDGFDADAVNRAIDDEHVTIVSVVAVMLQRMLDARADRSYPSSLRCVLLGGGPAPRPLLERCASMGIPVVQTYGLTETTSQIATLAPEDALRKLGSAGRPLYPNQIRIASGDHDAAPGEAGEVLVRGPVVMAGYAGAPNDGRVNGWFHTGDIGHLDAEGYLHVLDRRDDLIITGGENVYPAEVEAVLLAHPAVAEAGVVGVTDAVWGQRVVAIVRLAGTASANVVDDLRAHCRERLAGYKVPSEFRIVSEPLPRTASGKLKRAALSSREASPT
jgi:O-succinylbenzoic acid--CoA ligase